jgi:DNA-binding NtrC family response regulator
MGNTLLIIDDAPDICRMLERNLRNVFPVIYTASNAAEAEPLLEAEPITHVICDLFLGPEEPLGHELMRGWRKRKSNIQYVALFTGSTLEDRNSYDGIDDLFIKPDGIMDIIETLGAATFS